MPNPAPGYKKNPDHQIRLEESPRRVRVKFGGEWIADSTDMVLMYEVNHLPVYYFPVKDVRLDLLHPTDHTSHCPYKGDASYWSIEAGGKIAENAVWAYQTPFDEMTAINLQDYCAFYWNRVDHWFEEDEEVFIHPRDPPQTHRHRAVVALGKNHARRRSNCRNKPRTLPVRNRVVDALLHPGRGRQDGPAFADRQ